MTTRAITVYFVQAQGYITMPTVEKSDEEWQEQLTSEQYRVARMAGTEPLFSNAVGVYHCACCGNNLFLSETKFESGTG